MQYVFQLWWQNSSQEHFRWEEVLKKKMRRRKTEDGQPTGWERPSRACRPNPPLAWLPIWIKKLHVNVCKISLLRIYIGKRLEHSSHARISIPFHLVTRLGREQNLLKVSYTLQMNSDISFKVVWPRISWVIQLHLLSSFIISDRFSK